MKHPFRGHNDADSSEAINKRNFKVILDFRTLGDLMLQKHLMEGAKNAQYTSAEIQNEIINLCRLLILEKVVLKSGKIPYSRKIWHGI